MQEKTAPVFVVATANDVTQLPPEMLRKGRWDELFFVDLPSQPEREAIWKIQIARHGRKPKDFDMAQLARATDGLTGSEIEAVFVEANCQADFELTMARKVLIHVNMKPIPLLVLLTILVCDAPLTGAELESWKFGQPAINGDNTKLLIPVILELPKGSTLEKYALEVNKHSGLMTFGLLNNSGQFSKTSAFSFDIANTNEIKKLMQNYLAWKRQIPEEGIRGTVEMARIDKIGHVNYIDENGTCLITFHSQRGVICNEAGIRRVRDDMTVVRQTARSRTFLTDPSALSFILSSLDKIPPMFEYELSRKESREAAMDQVRKMQIQAQIATAVAVADKKLSDARKSVEAQSDNEQKERELARIKGENEAAIGKVGEEEALKRRAKIASFLTSKEGAELKTRIEKLSKSVVDRMGVERKYLSEMEHALERLMEDSVFGKVTKQQVEQATYDYIIAASNFKESSELQHERASLKVLLDEFKVRLGTSYKDAMEEMSTLRDAPR